MQDLEKIYAYGNYNLIEYSTVHFIILSSRHAAIYCV